MRDYFHRRTVLKALFTSVAGTIVFSKSGVLAQGSALPSWRDGKARQSILDFVAAVTREGSPGFVPVPQRVATFDNDGTLWCEQPM
ncbi:MAG TPA: haloacid dehalogenase-like hydrolase, partial [Pseudolabrys sp.]|nr:haloacid dehalogenase-like hydrolase [Pseudolabrys sp.]